MSVLDPLVAAEALDSLASQVAVLDGDGRIVLVNDAWRRFATDCGTVSRVDRWTGIDYLHTCRSADGPDGEEGPLVAAGIAAVLAGTRRRFDLEYPCDTPTRRRWFELQATPLPGADGGAVVAHHDITERKEAELERNELLVTEQLARRRASFMAEALEILERSLQIEKVCAGLAELCTRALADVAVVDVLDDRRRIVRAGVAVAGPDDTGLADRLRRTAVPHQGYDNPIRRALRERRPVHGAIDGDLLRTGFEPGHADIVGALGVRSFLTIPLHGRHGLIGALTVASRAAHQYQGGGDRLMVEDLARRASMALDNARLHSELEQTARVLQGGLRPAALPEIPGVELAAAYRPAGTALLVGGDFYDVVRLGGEHWAATIGDVCGKGAGAAVVTGLTRHTTRAAAAFGASPDGVLRALDDALAEAGRELPDDNRYCTALHAQGRVIGDVLDLDIAGAGHVPPIVVRASGATEIVEAGGALLGIHDTPRLGRARVSLDPGDALLLYTDGLLDAHAPDRQLFATDVAAALSPHAGRGARALLGAAEALAVGLAPARQRDDIAILVVAAPA